ncbi:MAG: sodium:glutamate symporter [Oscillospiraceae bacterium]|nr:sodium:glutamate symporter [Oscillospiraceae bacterium]
MDFSAANTALWSPIVQTGIIAGLILLANVMRRKIPAIRNTMIPTAVLAGFILLGLRSVVDVGIGTEFLEVLTYHALALGFIAMSLRIPTKETGSGAIIGSKSGALIVSTYLVQALVGLVISIGLAYTVMPDLFKASGILLPMAYGQGPGQANNVGTTYQALGMTGGRSFGLSLAAAGFLCACVVGVICLNVFQRKGIITRRKNSAQRSGSVTVDIFQDQNEIPISESVDKLSIQVALVVLVYLLTYLLTWGITALLQAVAPGLAATVSTLLWGFNFIIGSVVAMGCRALFNGLRKAKVMGRQYQNNYLLSRISGLAFDVMIVAGIASINIEDLSGYWLPFLLMAVAGGVSTYLYLWYMCRKVYPDYHLEGFLSMYGMLTGTISSGVLLLREVDPDFETPAANNLISGSSFGIMFGAPVLLLVSIAAKSDLMVFVAFGLVILYLIGLLLFIKKVGKGKKKTK